MKRDEKESSLVLLQRQRSHLLFVLSNARSGHEPVFLDWYQKAYRDSLSNIAGILAVQHYERHEIDITLDRYERLPFRYLGLYQLSVDGAQASEDIVEKIALLHREHGAELPATWLYYPVSERVGRSPAVTPSMLTLAFANSVPGQEAEFREWYATRHIRHAMQIPALVSGQCFQRTLFQRPGALEAKFDTIAVYEQEGSPESIIESCASLPQGSLDFPMLDVSRTRFAEWVYQPV